jgi:hypothetical protein
MGIIIPTQYSRIPSPRRSITLFICKAVNEHEASKQVMKNGGKYSPSANINQDHGTVKMSKDIVL